MKPFLNLKDLTGTLELTWLQLANLMTNDPGFPKPVTFGMDDEEAAWSAAAVIKYKIRLLFGEDVPMTREAPESPRLRKV